MEEKDVNTSYIDEVKKNLEDKKKTKEYQEARKGIFTFAIYLLGPILFIPIVIGVAMSYALNLENGGSTDPNDPKLVLLTAIAMLVFEILLFLWISYYNRKSLKEQASQFKDNFASKIKYTSLAFVILLVFNLALSFGLEKLGFGTSTNQEQVKSLLSVSAVPIALLSIGVLAPIIEEIVFRHSFFKIGRYHTKLDATKLNLLQALVFGLLHTGIGGDLIFLPLYMGMGYILGLIYLKTNDNLWYSSIAHVLNNVISILPLLFL